LAATRALAAAVAFAPASGTGDIAPDTRITVSTPIGTLTSVHATDSAGHVVPGTIATDGTSWRSVGFLQMGMVYHLEATVTKPGGLSAVRDAEFRTLTPTAVVTPSSVTPAPGAVVGVGEPIVVRFGQPVDSAAAQKAVVAHLRVAMSKPVAGGWHWFSDTELHFRPQTFWPAGEHVTITGDLNGWQVGTGNVWGSGRISQSFSVGDARVSVANLATHEMTVTLDGKVVATYPISGGSPEYPTMNGTHIVMDKESVVHMVSSTVGIPVNSPNGYDEYVYNDVHISDSGEYVHAAPWSVGAQGFVNVSHGCINLSTSNALTFMNFSQIGDVVEVVGGPRPPADGDHGVMDWSTEWAQWMPGFVVAQSPSTAPPATGASAA
jgi:lipoprotein-anchoring transpeptidase ErfK/SrfK